MPSFTFLVKVTPVCNKTYIKVIIICTNDSNIYWFQVVKVWDFDTGRQIFEFGGTNDLSAITCMTFDLNGRRYSQNMKQVYYALHDTFFHNMCLCLQTHHRWKRWLSKDLELQQWSVPKDIKERYVLIFS